MSNTPRAITWAHERAFDLTYPELVDECSLEYKVREINQTDYSRAFARYIAERETDPALAKAREFAAHTRRTFRGHHANCQIADKIEAGEWDDHMLVQCALTAIYACRNGGAA